MKDDPIVAEVRAMRDELAAQCGYDLKEIFRQLRQQQAKLGTEVRSLSGRRVVTTEDWRPSERDDKNG